MSKLLILLILSWSGFADELIVKLATEKDLMPLYISPLQDEVSGFSEQYLKQLESILRFDFDNNGMTQVVDSASKRKLDQTIPFDFQGDLSPWTREAVFYVIKSKVKDKALSCRVINVAKDSIKAIDGVALSGDFSSDRRVVHQLSDSIFKALFGKEGIASTRFLYTYKDKNQKMSTLFEADYDGGNARRVTEGNDLAITPSYIPPRKGYRSNSFLFVSYKTGQPKIYLGSTQDKQTHRFSLLKGNQLLPTMSKQRDKVAFISDVTGNPDLFLQDFDPEAGAIGKPRQIYATHKATQSSPSFSPDGKQIAFVSNQDGSPRIYILKIPAPGVGISDIKAQLISKLNRENTAPCWSPDGSKIAYSAQTKGVRQIWIYDLATRIERQLTDGPKNKENPTFAPNSLHLIYNTADADEKELYLLNLNQQTPIKISSGPGEKYFPSWEI